MIKKLSALACVLLYFGASMPLLNAQSLEAAKDYYQHGLNDRAKDILISLLHNQVTTPVVKAKALYILGQISFDEGRVKVALTDWQTLAKEYPQSPESKEITARLAQLNEMVAKVSDAGISSAVARSYISNGDFWVSSNDRKFTIDSSWLPMIELANEWYDRVIKEFPGSDAAEIAYERKLFALIGWRELGRDGEAYGLKNNYQKYMPLVLTTFDDFEKAFPNSSALQAFRYQIAQAYWAHRDWQNTRGWLQKIIDKGGSESTFYTEAAKARMQKVEY
jgi:tetratricopeptide (TPR) repeat protein